MRDSSKSNCMSSRRQRIGDKNPCCFLTHPALEGPNYRVASRRDGRLLSAQAEEDQRGLPSERSRSRERLTRENTSEAISLESKKVDAILHRKLYNLAAKRWEVSTWNCSYASILEGSAGVERRRWSLSIKSVRAHAFCEYKPHPTPGPPCARSRIEMRKSDYPHRIAFWFRFKSANLLIKRRWRTWN
jgi:hypothetical protein